MASYRFTKQAQKDIQRIIEQGREQFGIKQAISTPRKRKLAKTITETVTSSNPPPASKRVLASL